MKRWKYRFYVVDTTKEPLPGTMDRLGDAGWDIYQVTPKNDPIFWLRMKKEKTEDEE